MTSSITPISPESGESQSISDIILNLRSAFRNIEFDRAETELVSRDEALRRENSRLREELQSSFERRQLELIEMAELRDDLAGDREKLAKLEKENESLAAEVLEKTKKIEVYEKRLASLEVVRSSGVKSTPNQPIEILDSDDDCSSSGKLPQKVSSASKGLKRKLSLSPSESGNNKDPKTINHTFANGNTNQVYKSSVIKPCTVPSEHYNPIKKEASVSSDGSEPSNTTPIYRTVENGNKNLEHTAPTIKPSTIPAKLDTPVEREASLSSVGSESASKTVPKQTPPISDQPDKSSSGAKKSRTIEDVKLFWSRFNYIRSKTASPSPKPRGNK